MRLPRIVAIVPLALSVLVLGGCGGGRTFSPPTSALRPESSASNANAFMQSQTAKGTAPNLITAAPMAMTMAASPALMTRKPQTLISTPNWHQLPGSAQSIVASPDGTLYAISNVSGGPGGNTIWHYVNGSWSEIPGAAYRLAVGPDGTLWAITVAGGIYTDRDGNWTTMAGGASDITIGADGSVYVVANVVCCTGGGSIWHYVNGAWTQLPGAGTRISASWDKGAYPGTTTGGFYLTTLQNTIYYYSPTFGYSQLPGAAIQVAATNDGGLLAIGNDAAANHSIWYNDFNTGNWAQQPGAATSITASGLNFYATASDGSIWQSTSTAPAGGKPLTGNPFSPNYSGWGPSSVASALQFPVQNGYDGTGTTIAVLIDSGIGPEIGARNYCGFPPKAGRREIHPCERANSPSRRSFRSLQSTTRERRPKNSRGVTAFTRTRFDCGARNTPA